MEKMLVGKGTQKVFLLNNKFNQHGLIVGATGSGKTISLKVICEYLSSIGVPTILTDVKGDLVNITNPGSANSKVSERIEKIGIEDFAFRGFPLTLWDVYGKQGASLRITLSQMGPVLLARILDLNETQEGILNLAFRFADQNGLLLLDLKDLKALLNYIAENKKSLSEEFGLISSQSISAIQRKLLVLEGEGGNEFFQEPAISIEDFLKTSPSGMGQVNIINAKKLINSPKIYSIFLLWLLSELFEALPEVGNPEKPKCVFFFDEAHLLFDKAPKELLEKIRQVVKLIRSKGVGIFFITQNPLDIDEEVLNQLGNRIVHQLRAFSPKELEAVRKISKTFRPKEGFKVEDEILNLKTGEALVSFLDEDGSPRPVEKALIRPPESSFEPLSSDEIKSLLENSTYYHKYKTPIDRESAYEILKERTILKEKTLDEKVDKHFKSSSNKKTYLEKSLDSILGSMTRTIGREIARGLLGALKRR
ncbi:DUF853 domain-containing protein [Peptoniphilus sp. GNH]|nr:hypothetical protein HMPREF3189_00573 [Clostridiales bacterium KA00134]UHR02261.1 DUF853 domain-containing protein [Peptoniphilus sp. GNH]